MSRYEVVEDAPRYEVVEESPSVAERAGRVAGLGARAAVKGVSAIPSLMADAASELVNLGAKGVGADYRMQKPSLALDQLLTKIGLPQPETPVERVSSDVASGMAGMGGQIAALRQVSGPIAEQLVQQPLKQLIAGATGPGAASMTREAGGGAGAQLAASVAGSMAPFAPNLMRGQKPLTPLEERVVEARDAGYVVPPVQARPNLLNKALEGTAGKITTGQLASSKNQKLTTQFAAEELGLPPKTTITPDVLEGIRTEAGKAYGAIKILPLKFKTDAQFADDVAGLGKDFAVAAKEFPEIAGNKLVENLQESLSKPVMSPTAAIELIKKLRFDAAKNYKAFDDPAKAALASAQKQAATAIEGLVERRLTQSGKPEMVDAFRKAREMIAKTYDIEAALNETTGTVSAQALGNQLKRGAPLSGKLETAARFARAFPKAAQTPEAMGSTPGWSPLDNAFLMASGMGGAYAGSPQVAALGLLRPAVRGGILTSGYQNAMAMPTAPMPRDQAAVLGLLPNLYGAR